LSEKQTGQNGALARLDQYLVEYQTKLSEFIADETFNQETVLPQQFKFMPPQAVPPHQAPQKLRLQSEVAFIALPADAGWLGFRHVMRVDGRNITEGVASLARALQVPGLKTARDLLEASAQFNLGLPRTTNLPNLPLEFLHQRNRTRFSVRVEGREKVREEVTTRIVFNEAVSPTLIRSTDGDRDMPSVVHAWVRERTGELLRAEVETFANTGAKRAEHSVRVEFATVRGIDVLVPVEMREVFPVERPLVGTGLASYSNFRRFHTSARIVPQ